jgi:hypothetical protein
MGHAQLPSMAAQADIARLAQDPHRRAEAWPPTLCDIARAVFRAAAVSAEQAQTKEAMPSHGHVWNGAPQSLVSRGASPLSLVRLTQPLGH